MERLGERSREGRKETISKAKYGSPEGRHERSGRREGGEPKERKRERGTGEAAVRQKREERNGRNSGLSSRKRNGRGRKEPEGKRKTRKRAPEEQLWERIREGRKETYRVAEYRNRDRMHGKPGRTERGRPKERKRARSTAEATVRRRQEERERKKLRLSSQNPKLTRPNGCENSGGQKAEGKRRQVVERTAQRRLDAQAEDKGEPERSSCRE